MAYRSGIPILHLPGRFGPFTFRRRLIYNETAYGISMQIEYVGVVKKVIDDLKRKGYWITTQSKWKTGGHAVIMLK